MEEPDQKILLLSKVSTIIVASLHKSPLKSEGSMTMEVSNLLSRVILEASSCGSEHSSPRGCTLAAAPTTPPHKEGLILPMDTSSQVSADAAEASVEDIPSLEDIPSIISPIAATAPRTRSITPLVGILEFQTNANRALGDFLNTKASINAHRQRTVWDLGIVLCQTEAQTAKSIKQAKAACSQTILEAKASCSMVIKKAKTTRGIKLQEA